MVDMADMDGMPNMSIESLPLSAPREANWRKMLVAIPGTSLILLLLVLWFSFQGVDFAKPSNIVNIGIQSSVLLLLALPLTFILMSEGLDLSQGAVLSLASVVLAAVLAHGGSLPLALTAAAALGLLFGAVNGAFIAYLQMPPFVVTLGTLGLAHGIALVATDGESITEIGSQLPRLYKATVLGIPFPIIVALCAYALFHYLLYHTRFGSYVSAQGGNREALHLAGVNANRHLVVVYLIGGLMVGLAALLWVGRISSGHPTAGHGMEFDALVAVLLGGTRLEKGYGTMPGTLIGVLTVGVLRNGLNLMSVAASWQVVSLGVLVLAALWVESRQGEK